DGEYTIHGVPEGHYAMQYNTARAQTTAYTQYEGGSVDRLESVSDPNVRYVRLGAGEPVTTTLVAGYAVSGTVSVPEGIGMGDVSIRLERLQVDESDPESPE